MLLKRLYDETLAQASYLIGCPATHEAVVVDPNRDVDRYLAAARAESMKIVAVTETHIHADFVSGVRDLARRTGARLLLSGEGGPDWQYGFAATDGATLLSDGDSFEVGRLRLDVRHTPGHTPEHLVFVITDQSASEQPVDVLTGDFIFVGDVGRPDLLERAAQVSGSTDAMARQLYRSLQTIGDLADYVQIWPGHGPGSACGKALGAAPSSTLGYERLANWAFQIHDEDTFVREVLNGQPEPPAYFARMKTVNREGPEPPPIIRVPQLDLELITLDKLAAADAALIDIRPTADFAAAYIPGSINIPFGKSFTNWAGSLIPYDRDIVLLASDIQSARDAKHALWLIGMDRVAGMTTSDFHAAWLAAGRSLGSTPHVTPTEVAAESNTEIVDVRTDAEWQAGHIPGARHLFLGTLADHMDELSIAKRIVVHCQGGSRSAIAASMLKANGFADVRNMSGGFGAWSKAGLPTISAE